MCKEYPCHEWAPSPGVVQKLVRKSAFLASSVMANYVQKQIESIIETDRRVSHAKLSQDIEV